MFSSSHNASAAEVDKSGPQSEVSLARAHVNVPAPVCQVVENASQLQKRRGGSAIMRALLDDPEIVPLALAALKAALSSNQMYYNKSLKAWEAEPDARTRLAAAQVCLQYLEGLPLQRIESKSITADVSGQGAEVVLKNSPAAREALRRMLDRAEKDAAPTP